jgi:hypothetical protein
MKMVIFILYSVSHHDNTYDLGTGMIQLDAFMNVIHHLLNQNTDREDYKV